MFVLRFGREESADCSSAFIATIQGDLSAGLTLILAIPLSAGLGLGRWDLGQKWLSSWARWRNKPNLSQPYHGPKADGTPCRQSYTDYMCDLHLLVCFPWLRHWLCADLHIFHLFLLLLLSDVPLHWLRLLFNFSRRFSLECGPLRLHPLLQLPLDGLRRRLRRGLLPLRRRFRLRRVMYSLDSLLVLN